jgi:ATP-dependent helicase/nuclease subunit A
VTLHQNEEQFNGLIRKIISERRQFQTILKDNFGVDGLYTALCTALGIIPGKTNKELIIEACRDDAFDKNGLWDACKALAEGTPSTDQPMGIKIQNWLEQESEKKTQSYNAYKYVYLTTKNELRKKLMTAKPAKAYPQALDTLKIEALRIDALNKTLQANHIATLTRDLFLVAEEIINTYQDLKTKNAALDFDDLILKTLDLLQGNTVTMDGLNVTPWVRYKLDQGIDHLLVDEAQDTNPEQWQIIQALTGDFFDTVPDETELNRTLFVVGDQKQSIFGFQRADPEKFSEMREYFEHKIIAHGHRFETIPFNVSFRSTPAILSVVDSIFSIPHIQQGLGNDVKEHESFRYKQAGLVELWPIFETPETDDYDPWDPPTTVIESSSGAAKIASHIGDTIKHWIESEEKLESYDRKIDAGDILILVRSRNAFLDQLVRALKIRDIPVSGVDRMILSEQIAVQDLCAAAAFALLPEDDLTLACLLKSPFIGLNEEALFDICYNRGAQSVWQRVKDKASQKTVEWLENLIHQGGKIRPYEFFNHILQQQCPTSISGLSALKSRLGDECLDPIDEFMNHVLDFEGSNLPTLQYFIQAQQNNDLQIKREMEEAGNAVRIMTVHGAKGLQAPIVIMPDTIRVKGSTKLDKIYWPHKTGQDLPYFCPTSDNLPEICERAKDQIKQRDDEEYRRLLYVALTRAEERLYIGGYKGTKAIDDECWYNYIKQGLEQLDHVKPVQENELDILRYTNPATDKPDRTDKGKKEKKDSITDIPDWLFKPIESEPFPTRPLTPSKPSGVEMPVISPLMAQKDNRFKRGNITHKLLEVLPDIAPEKWEQAAQQYVAQPAHDLTTDIQQSIVTETLKILNDPQFTDIFSDKAMAEVPVTGLINNQVISGLIDRLLITDDDIFILDYKSNRPPPEDEKDIPDIYRKQMKAYADIMRGIYPNRRVRAALIWTYSAKLMELSDL